LAGSIRELLRIDFKPKFDYLYREYQHHHAFHECFPHAREPLVHYHDAGVKGLAANTGTPQWLPASTKLDFHDLRFFGP
jgi:hypothetical protein